MTVKFSLVVLRTAKMQAAVKFYSQLGVEFAEEKHGKGPRHFSGKVGDVVLEIYPVAKGKEANRYTRLGFRVINLDALVVRLRKLGARIDEAATDTPWGYRAVVRDPDGRAVELTQA